MEPIMLSKQFAMRNRRVRGTMDLSLMLIWELLVGFGLVFLIAVLILLVNPPEALVKRVFLGKRKKQ